MWKQLSIINTWTWKPMLGVVKCMQDVNSSLVFLLTLCGLCSCPTCSFWKSSFLWNVSSWHQYTLVAKQLVYTDTVQRFQEPTFPLTFVLCRHATAQNNLCYSFSELKQLTVALNVNPTLPKEYFSFPRPQWDMWSSSSHW